MRKVFIVSVYLLLTALMAACGASGPAASASLSGEPGKLAINEARERVKTWLSQNVPDFNRAMLSELQETDFGIAGLYEDTATQFYTLGTYAYAIYGGKVQRFTCMTVLSAETADVDGDGRAEPVLLCLNGSGFYTYQLFVIKDGTPYDYIVENGGYSRDYRLRKDSETALRLYRTIEKDGKPAGELSFGEVKLLDGKVFLSGGQAEMR